MSPMVLERQHRQVLAGCKRRAGSSRGSPGRPRTRRWIPGTARRSRRAARGRRGPRSSPLPAPKGRCPHPHRTHGEEYARLRANGVRPGDFDTDPSTRQPSCDARGQTVRAPRALAHRDRPGTFGDDMGGARRVRHPRRCQVQDGAGRLDRGKRRHLDRRYTRRDLENVRYEPTGRSNPYGEESSVALASDRWNVLRGPDWVGPSTNANLGRGSPVRHGTARTDAARIPLPNPMTAAEARSGVPNRTDSGARNMSGRTDFRNCVPSGIRNVSEPAGGGARRGSLTSGSGSVRADSRSSENRATIPPVSMNATDIRAWMEARRAASAREASERSASPLSAQESFRRSLRASELVERMVDRKPVESVSDEDLTAYETWARLRAAMLQ